NRISRPSRPSTKKSSKTHVRLSSHKFPGNEGALNAIPQSSAHSAAEDNEPFVSLSSSRENSQLAPSFRGETLRWKSDCFPARPNQQLFRSRPFSARQYRVQTDPKSVHIFDKKKVRTFRQNNSTHQ